MPAPQCPHLRGTVGARRARRASPGAHVREIGFGEREAGVGPAGPRHPDWVPGPATSVRESMSSHVSDIMTPAERRVPRCALTRCGRASGSDRAIRCAGRADHRGDRPGGPGRHGVRPPNEPIPGAGRDHRCGRPRASSRGRVGSSLMTLAAPTTWAVSWTARVMTSTVSLNNAVESSARCRREIRGEPSNRVSPGRRGVSTPPARRRSSAPAAGRRAARSYRCPSRFGTGLMRIRAEVCARTPRPKLR